jgi:large subunit ribosomal protein L10
MPQTVGAKYKAQFPTEVTVNPHKGILVPYAVRRKDFFYSLKQEVTNLSANFEAKKVVVEEITEKIKAAKSVVFVDYNKLTVAEVSELRSKCKKANCEYKVYKNTLVRKAFNELGYNQFDADLNGPTAIAFGADETSAAKVMFAASKDYTDKIVLKSAFVDNQYVDKSGVKALASMPSKEELVAKMLGSMQAPISNFVGVLGNLVSGIVRVLDQVAKSKAE